MVDKEPRLTSKQIQADLQTQGTTVSARTIRHHLNEKGHYGRRPRRTPLLTQRHKKARLEFDKTYVTKPQSFWENVLWTDETKVELFGKGHHGTVYRKRNEAFKEKNTVPTVKHGGGSKMLCCFWHWVPWLCERYHEIWWLPKNFGAQRSGQCQKAASPPEVTGLPAGQWPETHFRKHSKMVTNKALESSEMASNESRSESHRTLVERSQNSSWEKASNNFVQCIFWVLCGIVSDLTFLLFFCVVPMQQKY